MYEDGLCFILLVSYGSLGWDGGSVGPGNHIRMCWWLWEPKEPIREANTHGTQVASVLSNMPLGDHKWPRIGIILHTFAGEFCLSSIVPVCSPPFHALSLQGDDQPASQFQYNKFLYQDAFFFLQYVGWGSPVALSSGKLVLPVTMDVFLLHSLNGYPSSKSEAHKYRELVRFSTTRYHQTQHSTDRPWVVPRPVWKIQMSVRMWKPDKIPASQVYFLWLGPTISRMWVGYIERHQGRRTT